MNENARRMVQVERRYGGRFEKMKRLTALPLFLLLVMD
jgi:hypothetical protein